LATQASVNTIDGIVDNILLDTAEIGAAGAGLTDLGGMSTGMKAEVNAEVDTALADINLDHLVKSAVDTNFATTVHLDSVIGQIADVGTTATFDRTTDALEAIRNRGDAAWTTATGFATHTAADVWSVATRLLTAGTNIALAKGTGVTGFNDLSAGDVNAEVVDALNTDTYAEPGQGAPGATISIAQKIGFLYKAWRNKHTQTSTEYALYADNTTTKDHDAAVSDDGTTFERGEIGTGA
jgi:hypothetical protein